ncbi:MAG: hypothetical protein K8963_01965 [Proteobacteria bacterium]|nr:hypothetical protein [Pseudomonadota bacterium]
MPALALPVVALLVVTLPALALPVVVLLAVTLPALALPVVVLLAVALLALALSVVVLLALALALPVVVLPVVVLLALALLATKRLSASYARVGGVQAPVVAFVFALGGVQSRHWRMAPVVALPALVLPAHQEAVCILRTCRRSPGAGGGVCVCVRRCSV